MIDFDVKEKLGMIPEDPRTFSAFDVGVLLRFPRQRGQQRPEV